MSDMIRLTLQVGFSDEYTISLHDCLEDAVDDLHMQINELGNVGGFRLYRGEEVILYVTGHD